MRYLRPLLQRGFDRPKDAVISAIRIIGLQNALFTLVTVICAACLRTILAKWN